MSSFKGVTTLNDPISLTGASAVGSVLKINGLCLYGLATAVLAWWSWPNAGDYFAWYLLSAISGLVALGSFIGAVKLMIKLYRRDKVLAAFSAQGESPKTSTVVSDDVLDKAGMQ